VGEPNYQLLQTVALRAVVEITCSEVP
jgi:hypothetical protein